MSRPSNVELDRVIIQEYQTNYIDMVLITTIIYYYYFFGYKNHQKLGCSGTVNILCVLEC